MRRAVGAALVVVAFASLVAVALADAPVDRIAAGKRAFAEVARVLQSPRCQNCHPAGDAPLQGDAGRPHAMHVTRATVAAGVPCSTCHQEHNAESVGVTGGPPGAPGWRLPPAQTTMVFQGTSVAALCEQLRDPERNGHRTLSMLLDHAAHDPLVLWGWAPGGKRTTPPLSHAQFVAAFTTWVAAEGACPD